MFSIFTQTFLLFSLLLLLWAMQSNTHISGSKYTLKRYNILCTYRMCSVYYILHALDMRRCVSIYCTLYIIQHVYAHRGRELSVIGQEPLHLSFQMVLVWCLPSPIHLFSSSSLFFLFSFFHFQFGNSLFPSLFIFIKYYYGRI